MVQVNKTRGDSLNDLMKGTLDAAFDDRQAQHPRMRSRVPRMPMLTYLMSHVLMPAGGFARFLGACRGNGTFHIFLFFRGWEDGAQAQ